MSRRGQAGMTLIEVLIAVSLLSLLSVGMLFSIRAGLTAMEASNRRIVANRRAVGAHRILEQQVAGFLPVMARCGSNPMGATGAPVPYFQGMPAVMRFVTTYSLQGAARGVPQIVEIFVIPGQDGQGVRLVVNETPYMGPVGAGFLCGPVAGDPEAGAALPVFPPVQPSPRSFVLADRLAGCRFSYLESIEPQQEKWLPRWVRMDYWPKAVRIEMMPLEPDASKVPPMTFTGLIRPNRAVGEQYEF
ncbi:MAG TPA: prepilin-type N-terminal cleavage/methylation domain-containing protein [Paludibaculum sp.]